MNKENKIPFIIGITGHIDIHNDCIENVKQSIKDVISKIKVSLPDTPIYFFSPLAEGADRIGAEVALEMNCKLICPLPLEEDEYENDFKSLESKEEFQSLLTKAYKSYFVGYSEDNSHLNVIESSRRREQYRKIGEHIADRCNLLIACWDGIDSKKIAGTSQIVKYQEKGFEIGLFDELDGNALVKIHTNRKSAEEVKPTKIEEKYLGAMIDSNEKYEELLIELNTANQEISKVNISENNRVLENTKSACEKIANTYQSHFNSSLQKLVLISWFAVLFLEILHNFQSPVFMFAYVIAVLSAFIFYHFKVEKQEHQENFVFFRALSETIRIQQAWDRVGVKESVSSYYLKKQYSKVIWLKMALKNLYTLKHDIYKEEDILDYKEVKENWIENQQDYFKNKIKDRKDSLHNWEKWEKNLYISGLSLTFVTFLSFIVYYFHIDTFVTYETMGDIFHILLFSSGMSLVTAAFIGEKFLHLKAYKEEIYNFEIMSRIFDKATEKINEEPEKTTEIIKLLGIEALNENSQWVSLHYDRKLKPSLE